MKVIAIKIYINFQINSLQYMMINLVFCKSIRELKLVI